MHVWLVETGGWLVGWMHACLVDWTGGWLVGWTGGWLDACIHGWSVDWFVYWSQKLWSKILGLLSNDCIEILAHKNNIK